MIKEEPPQREMSKEEQEPNQSTVPGLESAMDELMIVQDGQEQGAQDERGDVRGGDEEGSKEEEVQHVDISQARAEKKRRLRELLANLGKNSGRVGFVKVKVDGEKKEEELSQEELETRRRNLERVAEWELELEEGDRWLQEWEEAHKDIYPKKEDEMLNPTTVLELEAKAQKSGPCILQPPSGPFSRRWRPNMTSYLPTSKLYRQFEDHWMKSS
ncbi:uncharacterized protein JCM6883_002521 [Sporobolomyces salmoneus]|uniref:uncharacterized protein n=1 Tax=Sporobolomyces salmoneus TaxID=183962 RepID=UPI0031718972